MPPNATTLSSLLAVILAMLSITLGASLAKTLFPLLGAAGTTLFRLGCAALLLSLVFRIWRMPFDRRTLLGAIPYGLSLGAMNLLFYLAIERIPLGVALAIEFIGPLTVALLGSRHRADFLWLALAIVGLLLLLPLRAAEQALDPLGVALALGAGVFWGLYMLTAERASREFDGAHGLAISMVFGALVALIPGIAGGGLGQLDLPILGIALAVALASSVIPYTLETEALRRIPRGVFGVLMSMEPAVAALAGLIVLGETLDAVQLVAVGIVVLASVGVTRSSSALERPEASMES